MTSPIFSSLRGNTQRSFRVAIWVARLLGIAFVIFLCIAWWDESQARQEPLLDGVSNPSMIYQWAIMTHLVPALVLLATVIWSWWRPLIGVIGFGLYTVLQFFVVGGELFYLPFVAGPPFVIVICYAIALREGRRVVE